MTIPNILKKVNLILVCEKRRTDRVHRCITPTFVVKPAFSIEMFKELGVGFSAPKVEVADFKVGPDCPKKKKTRSVNGLVKPGLDSDPQ